MICTYFLWYWPFNVLNHQSQVTLKFMNLLTPHLIKVAFSYSSRKLPTLYRKMGVEFLLKEHNSHFHLTAFVQAILFEIDCAIFYTNLYELFCQFMSWTNWVNSGKFMDKIADYHVKLWLIWKKFTVISYLLTCIKFKQAILGKTFVKTVLFNRISPQLCKRAAI